MKVFDFLKYVVNSLFAGNLIATSLLKCFCYEVTLL